MPILEDAKGNHILLALFDKKHEPPDLKEICKQRKKRRGAASNWISHLSEINEQEKEVKLNRFNEMRNVRDSVAMEILKQMSEYPFDLFKIKMSQIINKLMKIDIVLFSQYMDSRTKVISVITQVNMAKVK